MRRHRSHVIVLLLAGLTTLAWGAARAAQEIEAVFYQLRHRLAVDLKPLVEALLSPDGSVAADSRTNGLLISDRPAHLARVREALAQMDRPLRNVRIEARWVETARLAERGVTVDWSVGEEDWRVGTFPGAADRAVVVAPRGRKSRAQTRSVQSVLVLEGEEATLHTGVEVPVTRTLIDFAAGYGVLLQETRFETVDTGLVARPVVTGERIHLTLTPWVSRFGDRRDVRFTGAATVLQVEPGQPVLVGTVNRVGRSALGAFLSGRTRARGAEAATLMITAAFSD